MRLFDALQMTSAPVIDDAGNMLVSARSARTGVQLYRGSELGDNSREWARLYRPPEEVFSTDSLASYTAIPVTIDHPAKFVDSSTWKDVAVGETDGAIKDGDFIRVPFTVRHAKAIKSIRDGKSEISMGYSVDLDWTSGVTDAGEEYDVIARNLKMNHLAVVDTARGGHALKIGDDNTVPPKKEALNMKIVYDGLTVDMSDEAAANALIKKLTDKADAAIASVAASTKSLADAEAKAATDIAAKDAQIATLDAQVASLTKAVEDAKTTPEQLRDAAKAYAVITDAATKMGFTVTDAMSEAEIKKGAVLARLGDAYKEKSEAFFDAAFEIESGKLKDSGQQSDPYRVAMGDRQVIDFGDARTQAQAARSEYIKNLNAPGAAK